MVNLWVLLGVVVGYVLAYVPRLVTFFIAQKKPVRERAREPTNAAGREGERERAVFNRQTQNLFKYDGEKQLEIDRNTILERK